MSSITDRLRDWTRRKGNEVQGPGGAFAALVVVAALLLGLSGTIWLPERASVRTTMKVMPYNRDGIVIRGTERGCGSYRDTRQVGHGIGATIQLAAGFCRGGKRVWWIWGLHRANCYPIASPLTQVHMTCRIRGGGRAPIDVTYEARITSSLFPFVNRTVMLEVIVTPQGYVLQLPFQPI